MSRKVRLRAPAGTDEANFGDTRYRVDNDGTIEVPVEAAQAFEAVGGFEEIKAPGVLVEGHARVIHDDPDATCAIGGTTFEKQEDGAYHVPVHSVAALAAHGFVAIDEA